MTSAQLTRRIARQTDLPLATVRAVLAQLEDELVHALYHGTAVQLRGVGTLRLRTLTRGGRPPASAIGKAIHRRGIWAYPEFRPARRLIDTMRRRLDEHC